MVFVGQLVSIIGMIIGIRLITELVSPAEFGVVTIGLTFATLVNQLLYGPLANGTARFYHAAREKSQLMGYGFSIAKIVIYLFLSSVIILLVVVSILYFKDLDMYASIVVFAFIFSQLNGMYSTINAAHAAARSRKTVSIFQITDTWLRYGLSVVFILILGASASSVLLGYVIGAFIVVAMQLLFLPRASHQTSYGSQESNQWGYQIFTYSWPFAAWGIFTWARLVSDRWALVAFSDTGSVGLFAVLAQLGYYPVTLAVGIVSQFLSPIIYEKAGDGSDKVGIRLVNKIGSLVELAAILTTAVAFLISYIFHDEIFTLLVSEEYRTASVYLPWIIFSGGIFAIGQITSVQLMAYLKTRSMLRINVITSLLGVFLNFLLVYFYGLSGVIVSAILFSIIYYVAIKLCVYDHNSKKNF